MAVNAKNITVWNRIVLAFNLEMFVINIVSVRCAKTEVQGLKKRDVKENKKPVQPSSYAIVKNLIVWRNIVVVSVREGNAVNAVAVRIVGMCTIRETTLMMFVRGVKDMGE